jgi:hypothetical protein
MAIRIKQREQKWQLQLDEEVWEFENRKDMEAGLKTLLDLKEKKGNLKKDRR